MMLSSLILITVSALTANAPVDSPLWVADYAEALKQTREVERPLLVVLDVPADPAQRVDPELLNAEGKALAGYELCHIDVSTEYGKRVASVFRAHRFPHVAIIDRSGSVILNRIEGTVSTESWESSLARHKSGLRRGEKTYNVAKPVLGADGFVTGGYALPEGVEPAKPYCAACQRNQ